MKYNCDMIKDLLPLYADEVCSEESRKAVAEHLTECNACRSMLEKMNKQLVVNVNNDISTLKRIKQRIRIERIVISAVIIVTVTIAMFFTSIFLQTEKTMDYEKYNLAENVYAEEDAEGNVWIVKEDMAVHAWFIALNVRDKNGYCLQDEEFDKEAANAYMITLKERRINDVFDIMVGGDTELWKERSKIIDVNNIRHDKIDEVYYYDDVTDTEYLLWKRGE